MKLKNVEIWATCWPLWSLRWSKERPKKIFFSNDSKFHWWTCCIWKEVTYRLLKESCNLQPEEWRSSIWEIRIGNSILKLWTLCTLASIWTCKVVSFGKISTSMYHHVRKCNSPQCKTIQLWWRKLTPPPWTPAGFAAVTGNWSGRIAAVTEGGIICHC